MHGKNVLLFLILIFASAMQACRSADPVVVDQPIAPYVCRYADRAIVIDGKLDESAWDNAEVVDRFYPYTTTTDSGRSPTRVRMLWDDKNLYVAFECVDDDIWSFSDRDDDDLWNGDAVEFFLHADSFGLGYKEFVVAPGGAVFDAEHASRGGGGGRRFKAWDAGVNAATVINGTDGDWHDNDTSYTVEFALPLSSVGDIHKGMWTFGAFRYNYSKSFEEAQLLMSIPEAPKWGFHYYPGYRPVIFKRAR